MKKIWSVLLSVILILAMVGCGEIKENDKSSEAKTLIEKAMEKVQEAEHIDFSTQLDMRMQLDGEMVDMQMVMGVKIQDQGKETMKMAMPVMMKIPSQEVTMEMKMYYAEGYYYMDFMDSKIKTPMDAGKVVESVEDSTSATNIDAEGMMELTMEKKAGSRVITFVGDTEKMLGYTESIMESVKSMSGLDSADMTLEEIKGTITIDKDGYIREQVVDMLLLMQVDGEAVETTIKTTVTYNKVGEKVQVELPDLSEFQDASTLN